MGCNPSRCYPPEVIEERASNLNLYAIFELYLADSSIIKKLLIATYSTHALTLVFTNQKRSLRSVYLV